MNKEYFDGDTPFLSPDGLLFYVLRSAFRSGRISPHLLSEATGVEIDLCISFCSDSLAEIIVEEGDEEE